MHSRIAVVLLTILSFSFVDSLARAEIIDKTVAVVDGRIITLSDIRKEHEIEAVLGGPAETDDATLKVLMDRALLEEEMSQYPGLDVSDEEVDERMKTIPDLRGIPAADIRIALSREIQRFKYFSLRYRQFVVVSNEEIETYYNTIFVPEAKKRGGAVPDLSPEVTESIRANIFEEKVSSEVETSLESLRARSNSEIF